MPRSYSSEMLTSDSYYAANSAVTRPANGEYTVSRTSYIISRAWNEGYPKL